MNINDVDEKKIKKAIEAEMPILITTYTLPHDMEIYIKEVISCFLRSLNQDHMIEYVSYCIQELMTNAKKANTKRVYFTEKGLNIFDEQDYKLGMKTFKDDTLGNIDHYMTLQKKSGLYVKVLLQKIGNQIKIEIRNNSEMTFFEYKRIHDKVARAGQFNSIEEAFDRVLDNSEGAGLGIVIMMLMMKSLGMDESGFFAFNENGETVIRFLLNINRDYQNQISVASKDVVCEIDNIPHFSSEIKNLTDMLDSQPCDTDKIAEEISKNPKISSQLLQLVKSTSVFHSENCINVKSAINSLGCDVIKKLLFAIGTINSLTEGSEIASTVWKHCNKIAFYAYNLSANFYPNDKDLLNNSYVCALLHDMGKIVFFGMNIHTNYSTFCENYNVPKNIFEQLASGVNHAEIGAMVAEKWNFPQDIIQGIRFHHNPESAPEKYRTLTEIIYLANMISCFNEEEIEFYQFNMKILKKYNLDNYSTLLDLAKQLESAYTN